MVETIDGETMKELFALGIKSVWESLLLSTRTTLHPKCAGIVVCCCHGLDLWIWTMKRTDFTSGQRTPRYLPYVS